MSNERLRLEKQLSKIELSLVEMGEPASASVRLQLDNKTLVEMKVGSGREQLQNLQKNINQFLTELIVQQSGDQPGINIDQIHSGSIFIIVQQLKNYFRYFQAIKEKMKQWMKIQIPKLMKIILT